MPPTNAVEVARILLPLTKIVATTGPASRDAATLEKLLCAGVSICRLNFSHGRLEDHAACVTLIRTIAERLSTPVAILGDLQGPKIRVGAVESSGIELVPGDTIIFERGNRIARREGTSVRASCTHDRLIDDLKPGERLLINDGAIRTLVVNRAPDQIECMVTVGGLLTSGKGINLPDSTLSVPALGDHDHLCVRWSVEQGLDFLALSFVRTAAEVRDLRALISRESQSCGGSCPTLPIVAKIELPAAVANIDAILDEADALMVARGDLGVEMDLARVPVIQKRLIEAAQAHGKPCIVATQMLESMIHSRTPTRAEASDVANAIIDGADAVMLSGETAVGSHPALAVDFMRLIALNTEEYLATLPPHESPPARLIASRYRTAALAHGAWTMAKDFGAKAIVVWSQQGGGARLLSQNNFSIPIIAFSSDPRAIRQMQLLRGVIPVLLPAPASHAAFAQKAERWLLANQRADVGDRILIVAGTPLGVARVTNSIAMHEVGDAER